MKLRAFLFVTLIFVCSFTKVFGQSPSEKPVKHSVSCAVGPFPSIMISWAITGRDNQKLYPIALISYKRIVSKRWKYGLTGAYEPSKRWYYYAIYLDQPRRPPIVYYSRAFTVAAEGSLNYIKTPSFTFYGTGSIGLSYSKKTPKIAEIPKDESFFMNGQFTPFGFRYGKKMGVSAEFGIGYKGLINFGADYQF